MLINWQMAISIYRGLAGAAVIQDEELLDETTDPLLDELGAPLFQE